MKKVLSAGVLGLVLASSLSLNVGAEGEIEVIPGEENVQLTDEQLAAELAAQESEVTEAWTQNPVEVEPVIIPSTTDISPEFLKKFKDTPIQYAPEAGYTGIGSKGDVLISTDSLTDHVAIVYSKYLLIEAHPDNAGGKVDYRDNNWKSRYKNIKAMYVKGSSGTQKSNAAEFARAQIGDPYSLAMSRSDETRWYCSKLVWRAWYKQGVELEGRTYEPRGNYVTPGDILDSPNTTVFYSTY